ncbi:MAG TPA: DNA alkylation repair protein [Chryseolinea sp.]|nr:DNA alkylation repair protein [Chryseolinea sp.]
MVKAKKSKKGTPSPSKALTARQFVEQLSKLKTKVNLEQNSRFFRDEGKNNSKILGVRMAKLFALSKSFTNLDLDGVEELLENEYYEVRMGAVCIMDFQARNKKTSSERRKELFDLYMRRHDRIDNWDLIDRSAGYVVGSYLIDKPRTILYNLAKSKNIWERRTAMVSTSYFIRYGDVGDTFKIAEMLVGDKHDLIHKAVGSWIREAGKKDKKRLIDFLDEYAAVMPRTMLRYATERLEKKQRGFFMMRANP